MEKSCVICGRKFESTEYSLTKTCSPRCRKELQKRYLRTYRREHPEKFREASKRFYYRHLEQERKRKREGSRRFYYSHLEQERERKRKKETTTRESGIHEQGN